MSSSSTSTSSVSFVDESASASSSATFLPCVQSFENNMDTPVYTVYELTKMGHMLNSTFISKSKAIKFAREMTSETSQVYVYKSKCIKAFDSTLLDQSNLKMLAHVA